MKLESFKILLIEDEDDHAILFENVINSSRGEFAEIVRATSLTEGIELSRSNNFDIIVLDLGLPESQGLDTLKSFFLHRVPLPVVVLTSQANVKIGTEAVHMGAQDYLPKEMLSLENLQRCIRYAVERYVYIAEIDEKARLLEVSLREKEVLIKEIHHRVKNNMQVISSLLRLQSHTIDDAKVKKLFEETRDRVVAMSLVHEKLYQSTSLSEIDIGEYTNTMADRIFRTYVIDSQKVKLNLNTSTVYLPIDKAVPYGIILNELVSNALKHGFSDGSKGTISVSLSSNQENCLELVVKDDGVGLVESFKLEDSSSMGADLINVLTKQLRGSIEYSSEGRGACFCLRVPLNE